MNNEKELKEVLLKQYKLHPKMQLHDMVKLIYQNEFAGGHMITNEEESLTRLKDEFYYVKGCSRYETSIPLYEHIGNGLCRLNLAALAGGTIELSTVNKFFVNTANSIVGSFEVFEEKLDILRDCCREGLLPYSLEELDLYITEYKKQGYPPVSHSQDYRTHYSPSYRIVKEEYCRYFDVFRTIDSLMKSRETVNVAIDGNSGAGKSTIADLLGEVYDCNIFHMDDFFLRPELRTEERLKEVGGNVDYVRFKEEVIDGLKSGREFKYQPYNCQTKSLEEPITVTPKKLNIVEGVYSMHPTLIDTYDLKIFLAIEPEEQSRRILLRNGEFMHKRFVNEWIPLEDKYFEHMQIRQKCDLVFEA